MQATPPETIKLRAPISSADFDAAAQQFFDHGVLERREQIERRARSYGEPLIEAGLEIFREQSFARGDFAVHIARFHPAQHGGFDAAETEIERVAFHLCAA